MIKIKIPNISNTFQLIQGILLAVSAKQFFKSRNKSPKNNEVNEALSSQRSGVDWPSMSFNLLGVCRTLDGELTGPICENIYLDNHYYNYDCQGTLYSFKSRDRKWGSPNRRLISCLNKI